MKPTEFRERFRRAQPEVPLDLDLDLDLGAFCSFPVDRVASLPISEEAKAMLIVAGLPEQAPPFLSFLNRHDVALSKITEVDRTLPAEFNVYRILGHNAYGDPICLDERDGSIVYLNHDSNMERVFINSSLVQFAETLCLVVEVLHGKEEIEFHSEASRIDSKAMQSGAMWASEVIRKKKK